MTPIHMGNVRVSLIESSANRTVFFQRYSSGVIVVGNAILLANPKTKHRACLEQMKVTGERTVVDVVLCGKFG